MLIKDWWIPW